MSGVMTYYANSPIRVTNPAISSLTRDARNIPF
jgi:hypothetical protein